MAGGISIVRTGGERIMQRLQRIVDAARDPSPALAAVGNVLLTNVQLGFRTSTDPYGEAWEAITHRTGKPLRDTGLLRDAWFSRVEGDEVVLTNNRRVSWRGRTWSLAAIHQYGATITPRDVGGKLKYQIHGEWVESEISVIPPRPMIPTAGLPEEWELDVLDVLDRYFLGGEA